MNNKSHRNVSGDSGRYCFDDSHKLFGVFRIVSMSSVKNIQAVISLVRGEIPLCDTNKYGEYQLSWKLAYLQAISKL